MNCPTCGTHFPDPPFDAKCCECGKDFYWPRMAGMVFTQYRTRDGQNLPICSECLEKGAYPVAYRDKNNNWSFSGTANAGEPKENK